MASFGGGGANPFAGFGGFGGAFDSGGSHFSGAGGGAVGAATLPASQ